MADVSLTPGVQSALDATRTAAAQAQTAANRLALGRQVLSALDGATAFSQSVSLGNRAQDLLSAKDQIDNGLGALRGANDGLTAVGRFLEQAKSIAQRFENATPDEQAQLQDQFNTVSQQIDNLTGDTSFVGRNLIGQDPSTLSVGFDPASGSGLDVAGRASDTASLGLTLNTDSVDNAIAAVRANQSALGFDSAVLQVRDAFNQNLASTLDEASAKLVSTDINEQAATALSSQTRAQLGILSLSVTTQSDRAITSLF
jgi:flagellin-like hook-associated protein FlgL